MAASLVFGFGHQPFALRPGLLRLELGQFLGCGFVHGHGHVFGGVGSAGLRQFDGGGLCCGHEFARSFCRLKRLAGGGHGAFRLVRRFCPCEDVFLAGRGGQAQGLRYGFLVHECLL